MKATKWQQKSKRECVYVPCVCMCACVRGVCVCVCVCVRACQRKTKDRADGMREKVPIPLDGIWTCTSGIRAHRASDYTTRVRPPRVSWNKHFRHSLVSSTAKQSCTKHSNSYLRDRDVKHLQGRPLSRTKRVRERRKIELTVCGKKVPIPLNGIWTCTSGIRAHRASNYTTRARPPHVSRNKHFRHSPVSSTGVCVCVCVCVCVHACVGACVCTWKQCCTPSPGRKKPKIPMCAIDATNSSILSVQQQRALAIIVNVTQTCSLGSTQLAHLDHDWPHSTVTIRLPRQPNHKTKL